MPLKSATRAREWQNITEACKSIRKCFTIQAYSRLQIVCGKLVVAYHVICQFYVVTDLSMIILMNKLRCLFEEKKKKLCCAQSHLSALCHSFLCSSAHLIVHDPGSSQCGDVDYIPSRIVCECVVESGKRIFVVTGRRLFSLTLKSMGSGRQGPGC